jgi:hypothetical protein
MIAVQLSEAEIRILKQYKKQALPVLVQAKSEALILLHENIDIPIISRIVNHQPSKNGSDNSTRPDSYPSSPDTPTTSTPPT